MEKEFHLDNEDKRIVEENILPNMLTGYCSTHWTTNKYDNIDGFTVTHKNIYKVHVKNREDYSINQYSTILIDRTCYYDSQQQAIVIILYPMDEKILIYTSKSINNAFKEHTTRTVNSYNEKTGKWYKQHNKELTELYINKGKIFDYKDFNIAV